MERETERRDWDEAAADFQHVFALGMSDYSASLLRFWQETGMVRPGCRVLDIGCGVGKYGCYLARLGCRGTLTDISGEMLRLAAENMASFPSPWLLHEGSFDDVTGREPAFSGGFDFAISTMSPAVHDAATVRKMSSLSRGWCFLARFRSWEQPLRDRLLQALGATPQPAMTGLAEDVAGMIRTVREVGYDPIVRNVPYDWEDLRSPEEMAETLCRRCFEPADRDRLFAPALSAARAQADGSGLLRDGVHTTVAWIFWKT